MSRKSPFAAEPKTKPDLKRQQSEAPTIPPPAASRTPKTSTVRPKRQPSIPAATVDEVTADLKKDPRREE